MAETQHDPEGTGGRAPRETEHRPLRLRPTAVTVLHERPGRRRAPQAGMRQRDRDHDDLEHGRHAARGHAQRRKRVYAEPPRGEQSRRLRLELEDSA